MIVGINQPAITMVLQLRNLEATNVPLRIQITWKAPCGMPNAVVRSGSPTRPLLFQSVSKVDARMVLVRRDFCTYMISLPKLATPPLMTSLSSTKRTRIRT